MRISDWSSDVCSSDLYAGLAPEDMLLRAAPHDLELDDGGVATPATLKEMALAAEAAARAVPGVTNSEGGSASIGRATVAIATSHGFEGGYSGTSYGTSRSAEHTSELQSLMRISYAVFCLNKTNK